MFLSKVFILGLLSMSGSSFAYESEFEPEEGFDSENEINHEMQIGCVAGKTECKNLAQQSGYPFLRAVLDRARCPQSAKPRACIVQH